MIDIEFQSSPSPTIIYSRESHLPPGHRRSRIQVEFKWKDIFILRPLSISLSEPQVSRRSTAQRSQNLILAYIQRDARHVLKMCSSEDGTSQTDAVAEVALPCQVGDHDLGRISMPHLHRQMSHAFWNKFSGVRFSCLEILSLKYRACVERAGDFFTINPCNEKQRFGLFTKEL
jgi:hypothetical protein